MATTLKRASLTGPKVQALLGQVLPDLQKVTRRDKPDGYQYEAEFFTPGMVSGVQPAAVYGLILMRSVDGVIIIDSYDSIADWREGAPVVTAALFFNIQGKLKLKEA